MTDAGQTDEARVLSAVETQGWPVRYRTYLRLSGPGWLQSALSLGGGSLASSLYLGVLAGYSMLWLQPLAMLLGIIMISALGYVTLATDERPLHAVNRHVNPVLGWGWAAGALLSSIVFAMPQFSLANGVMQQNLLPGVVGPDGLVGGTSGMLIVSLAMLAITLTITWNYDRGRTGVRVYEWILKGMVAVIVLSFLGVVVRLTLLTGAVNWGELVRGVIPKPALIFRPAEGFGPLLAGLPEMSREFWTGLIVRRQQDIMAAALASAVGVNMTFLFAYSMLRRGWGTEYKRLMRFDLAVGMFLPFTLVTSFVLIASTSQFHTAPPSGFVAEQVESWQPPARQAADYNRLLEQRVRYEHGEANPTSAELATGVAELDARDHFMAATLLTRDAFDLAFSLEPLLGGVFSHIIFGIGVLGMALSSITLQMLVSGMVLCEILRRPHTGWLFRLGTLAAGLGFLGPFFWTRAAFWLAIPASIITLMMLPVAYITFMLMMNNRALLGPHMPRGNSRVLWNTLTIGAATVITSASLYMLWTRGGAWGLAALGAFLVAVGVGEWRKRRSSDGEASRLRLGL